MDLYHHDTIIISHPGLCHLKEDWKLLESAFALMPKTIITPSAGIHIDSEAIGKVTMLKLANC